MPLPLIYRIRHVLNEEVDLSGDILIIDSFPVPVCQPVRNCQAKIFSDYANIGYKATKKYSIMDLKFTRLLVMMGIYLIMQLLKLQLMMPEKQ